MGTTSCSNHPDRGSMWSLAEGTVRHPVAAYLSLGAKIRTPTPLMKHPTPEVTGASPAYRGERPVDQVVSHVAPPLTINSASRRCSKCLLCPVGHADAR